MNRPNDIIAVWLRFYDIDISQLFKACLGKLAEASLIREERKFWS